MHGTLLTIVCPNYNSASGVVPSESKAVASVTSLNNEFQMKFASGLYVSFWSTDPVGGHIVGIMSLNDGVNLANCEAMYGGFEAGGSHLIFISNENW